MNTTAKRLRKFQPSTLSQWRQHTETRLANQDERRKARIFAMQMLDAMEKQEITESVLAERLGISTTELLSFLRGHEIPTSVIVGKMASILGITLSSIP